MADPVETSFGALNVGGDPGPYWIRPMVDSPYIPFNWALFYDTDVQGPQHWLAHGSQSAGDLIKAFKDVSDQNAGPLSSQEFIGKAFVINVFFGGPITQDLNATIYFSTGSNPAPNQQGAKKLVAKIPSGHSPATFWTFNVT